MRSPAFIFALLVFALCVVPTQAQGKKNSLELGPAYADVVLESPTDEKEVEFTAINHSNEPLALELFAIDFRQSSPYGVVSFVGQEPGTYSYSLASFLSFETNRLDLDPGQSRTFKVFVKNRQDLTPGGHYAAVVVRQITESKSGNAEVTPAISSLVYLHKKGGEQFHLSIQEVSWPKFPLILNVPTKIDLVFQNEGNIHLLPYGRIEIKDVFGKVLSDGSINGSSLRVFPETRRIISVPLSSLASSLPISIHTLEISGYDSLKRTAFVHKDTYVYVHPAAGAGLVIFSLLIIWQIRKRKVNIKNKKAKKHSK